MSSLLPSGGDAASDKTPAPRRTVLILLVSGQSLLGQESADGWLYNPMLMVENGVRPLLQAFSATERIAMPTPDKTLHVGYDVMPALAAHYEKLVPRARAEQKTSLILPGGASAPGRIPDPAVSGGRRS